MWPDWKEKHRGPVTPITLEIFGGLGMRFRVKIKARVVHS